MARIRLSAVMLLIFIGHTYAADLEMHNDVEGKKILKDFGIKRFIETGKEDYTPVFDLTERAGIDLKKYDYVNK